jgi:Arc-like DNA binding domain
MASIPSFKLRLPGELRQALDEHAKATGRSTNTVIVDLLWSTFHESPDILDEMIKSRDVRSVANTMVSTFVRAGRDLAEMRGHPDWGPDKWIADPVCYRGAALAVAYALLGDLDLARKRHARELEEQQ